MEKLESFLYEKLTFLNSRISLKLILLLTPFIKISFYCFWMNPANSFTIPAVDKRELYD